MIVGKKIKHLREEMCISRAALSKIIAIPLNMIVNWEDNGVMPDGGSIRKIAETFGVPETYFTENVIEKPEIKLTVSLNKLLNGNNIQVLRYLYPSSWKIKFLKYKGNDVFLIPSLSVAFKSDSDIKSHCDNYYYNKNLENYKYYLIYKFGNVFIACFSDDKLILKKYTNLPFKKRLFMYRYKNIIFDDKKYYIYNSEEVVKPDNTSMVMDTLSSLVCKMILKIILILFEI